MRAYELHPHPSIRVNLANCYSRLGRAAVAVLHFRAYLRDPAVRLTRGVRREIEQELADLERNVGTLELSVVPDDAQVTIDGSPPEARDGTTIILPVGSHALELRAPGRRRATRSLEIVAGATATVSVQLEVEPPAAEPVPAPPPPAVAATAAPPVVPRPAPAGDRPQPPEPPSGPPPFLRWGALGLATATGIAAGVLGSLALDASERFDEAATRIEQGEVDDAKEEALRRQARGDADRANDLALWTDVMLGVTAAAAIGAVVLFLTAPSDPAAADGAQVEVSGLAGGAAIRVTGNF